MRHQSPEKKKETGGVLRDILVIEDEGVFNVAFLRVNGCHSDNLNSRAEVPSGWNVFIYLHCATHLGEGPHPVFGWKAHISMVRHQDQEVLRQKKQVASAPRSHHPNTTYHTAWLAHKLLPYREIKRKIPYACGLYQIKFLSHKKAETLEEVPITLIKALTNLKPHKTCAMIRWYRE